MKILILFLWLLDDNEAIKQNIINYFKNNNIHSSRILFANKVDTKTHISRMSLADIFLDSYPCNAHTIYKYASMLIKYSKLSELICNNLVGIKKK